MNITIRPIQETDFTTIIELISEFAGFEKQADKMTNSASQMLEEKEYFNGFVAVTDQNEIIGYTAYFFAYFTWVGKSLFMDDLFVTENYRQLGIGRQLLDAVINHARQENCKKVRWQVSNWNSPAMDFYQKLGAKIDDTELNCDLLL